MTFVSYAQNLEDVILWRALRTVDAGFYIDVGAWDPRDDSVTCAFYERGWRGINVEPDPELWNRLKAARPRDINLQIALSDSDGEHSFYRFPGTGWSTLDAGIARDHTGTGNDFAELVVRTARLADICALYAPAEIHFLKIDVEGFEPQVLAGADFNKYRPWIIVAEATRPNSPEATHQAWEPTLLNANYLLAYSDGLNHFYVAEEKSSALLANFSQPPNVFDDFISAAMLRKAFTMPAETLPLQEIANIRAQTRAEEAAAHQEEMAAHQEVMAARQKEMAEVEARLQKDMADVEARLHAAEIRALDAEMWARLAQADARLAPGMAGNASAAPAGIADLSPYSDDRIDDQSLQQVYYDAGLILHYGFSPPVGIVRVEQYVAEMLVRRPSIALQFVLFDGSLGGYRALSATEDAFLHDILFRRYSSRTSSTDDPAPSGKIRVVTPEPPAEPSRRSIAHKLMTASRLPYETFNEILCSRMAQAMPIKPEHSPIRRAGTRLLRRSLLSTARIGHWTLSQAIKGVRTTRRGVTRLATADAIEAESLPPLAVAPAPTPSPGPRQGIHVFNHGDVLITIANTWDYMDYAYLTRIVRREGVRLISVIYDVIAVEQPFTCPGPPHLYHRHWVELGHLADHMVAISRHSMNSYRRSIGEPNDLDPTISYAYLPNFLHHRRNEIGEIAVPTLLNRRFVVFCSTIETRKNHQLLLHAWERLRQEIDGDTLPVLVFVGIWGWGTETVRLIVERNWRLRSHLLVLNKATDAELIWLYRNALFTAFPAMAEGFGLAAAESLSFGTPVIVSDCPALIEASEGLMPAYDPLDFPGWLAELRRLILDDAYLQSLRTKAAGYRGAGYEDFAAAILDAVQPQEQRVQESLVRGHEIDA